MLYVRVKTMLLWSAILAVVLVSSATGKPAKTSKLTKFIMCKRSDPQLGKCIAENMKSVFLKYAKTGIPELNMPIFEPYVIQELDLKVFKIVSDSLLGSNGQKSDKYKAFARNIAVHGVSELIIHDLKTNFEKKEVFLDVSFPRLQVEGDLDVNLMMLNLPIKSTGPVFMNLTDTSVKLTLNGKAFKRKDSTYYLFDTIDIKMDFKDYLITVDKLFKKDQIIYKVLNDMMKNQKTEIKNLAIPIIEEFMGKMILEMLNKILSGLPVDELFLPE